jgi:hypothetical protein
LCCDREGAWRGRLGLGLVVVHQAGTRGRRTGCWACGWWGRGCGVGGGGG